MNYYRMGTNHREPCPPLKQWVDEVTGHIFCLECHKIIRSKVGTSFFDTYLGYNPPPGHRIMGGLSWIGLCIYHVDFISQIKNYLDEYGFIFGKCLDNSGNVVKEYVTCYNSYYIVQRGNEKTKYKHCKNCNTLYELEWWHGRQYLIKDSLKEQKIVQEAGCDLYIEEKLFKSLDFSKWRDAAFEKIVVLDEPEDGQVLPK